MAVVNTLIGHIKGPKGDTGETGATGATGAAGADATVTVGSTTTVPYGQTARVTNTGTPGAAVFNFTIPQGKPGEQTTKLDALTLDALTEPSASFPVPAIGDNGSTLFGKISKWFSDMSALVATKFNAANVVNNLTTTASGYALDARQGKAISDGALFSVRTGAVYQNRIQNANLNFVTFNTGYKHAILTYNFFQVGSADIQPNTAIATGFWQPTHNTAAPLFGHAADGFNTIGFFINNAGSLCNGNQTLTAGKWYVCQGYYVAN